MDLPIRGVHDCTIESFVAPCTEEVPSDNPCPGYKKVFIHDTSLEPNPGLLARDPAQIEGGLQMTDEHGINLVCSQSDRIRSSAPPAHRRHKRGRKGPNPSTGVEYTKNGVPAFDELGHERGHGRRREKLPHQRSTPRVQPACRIAPG